MQTQRKSNLGWELFPFSAQRDLLIVSCIYFINSQISVFRLFIFLKVSRTMNLILCTTRMGVSWTFCWKISAHVFLISVKLPMPFWSLVILQHVILFLDVLSGGNQSWNVCWVLISYAWCFCVHDLWLCTSINKLLLVL